MPTFRQNKFGNLGVKLSKKQWIHSYAELTQQHLSLLKMRTIMKKIESSSSALSKNPEKKLKINSTFMTTSFLETKRSRVYSRLSESGIFPAIMTTFLVAIDPIAYDHCVGGISDNMNYKPNHLKYRKGKWESIVLGQLFLRTSFLEAKGCLEVKMSKTLWEFFFELNWPNSILCGDD